MRYDDDKLLATIERCLSGLRHPPTVARVGHVTRQVAVRELLRLRRHIVPSTSAELKAKLLRDIDEHVRWLDMIYDDLWDREEPIADIYEWCSRKLGRPPTSIDEITEHISDAIDAMELG